MPDWELKLITAEAQRLIALAAQDPNLRADLRALAQEILAATEVPDSHIESASRTPSEEGDTLQPPTEVVPPPVGGDAMSHNPSPPEAAGDDRAVESEPLRELTLGRRTPSIETAPPSVEATPPHPTDNDLDQISSRCRAKAKAARWAAERQRQIHQGDEALIEEAPSDPEMVQWADRLTDCFYWLNALDTSQRTGISLLDDVAGCFEAIAEASSLVVDAAGHRGRFEKALHLLAEAQSALRGALQRLQAPDDPDQLAAYEWVRRTAAQHRIYLKRHLRADDLAEPSQWPDLLARVEALTGTDSQSHPQRHRIEQVRQDLKALREGSATAKDWRSVVEAVDEMVGEGVPPSSRQIRELLLPILDDLPDLDDVPTGFRLVLREIDRYLAARTPASSPASTPEPAVEVREVVRLLEGKAVVLIGGVRRPEAQQSLKQALRLKELVWIETKEHQAIQTFEPVIARPDVVLVLLAIRWSSHAFGDVKQYCDRHGKPLVRLPGGYGVNQVATQILSQCSIQLGDR